MKNFLTLSMLFVFAFASTTVSAKNTINSEDNVAGIVSMNDAYSANTLTKADMRAEKRADKLATKAEKKEIRTEKRMTKLNNFMMKHFNKSALGGFDDPIDKFLWWAIIAAGAAIIFSFIYWPISTIFWIGSLVLLVLWIIKKFA